MNIKERIVQLEDAFRQQTQIRDKATADSQNAARALDQISGALMILRELYAEEAFVPEGNGVDKTTETVVE